MYWLMDDDIYTPSEVYRWQYEGTIYIHPADTSNPDRQMPNKKKEKEANQSMTLKAFLRTSTCLDDLFPVAPPFPISHLKLA